MEKKDHEYCLRCGRKLKNPTAREKGYGVVCERKMKLETDNRLFTPTISNLRRSDKMSMYQVIYNINNREVREEIPADSSEKAKELLLQKINGIYTDDALSESHFRITGIDLMK